MEMETGLGTISQAIQAAVAAARWRQAARFETGQTKGRMNSLADERTAAVAAALAGMVGGDPHRASRPALAHPGGGMRVRKTMDGTG